jgi:hypothetical protein
VSWLEDYLAGLSEQDLAEFHATAAKAPEPTEARTARVALWFQTKRRKAQLRKKSA